MRSGDIYKGKSAVMMVVQKNDGVTIYDDWSIIRIMVTGEDNIPVRMTNFSQNEIKGSFFKKYNYKYIGNIDTLGKEILEKL